MKKIILVLAFLPFISFAQNETEIKHFNAGCGFSAGFFNPSKVNDYIEYDLSRRNLLIQSGFSNIILNLGGRVFLGYTTDANIGFEGFFEAAIAPKIVKVTNGSSTTYLLNRLSPGIKLTYKIRINEESNIVVGAGPMFNRISFFDDDNKFKGSSIGGKFELKYEYKMENFTPSAFIDIDYAKAKDKGLEMGYTGVELGVAIAGNW